MKIKLKTIKKAVLFLADTDKTNVNVEYNRGLCELLAELDPIEDVDTADRTQEIANELDLIIYN